MKKSELKTGMTVCLVNNQKYMVLLDTNEGDNLITKDGWMRLSDYKNDLTFLRSNEYDIKEVYKPTHQYQLEFNCWDKMELIWERKEEKPVLKLDGVEYSETTLRSLIKKATQ
jgi:hypothetical protein